MLIATRIPDTGDCFVQIDQLNLTAEDAIKLGTEIAAAGKRCLALNAIRDKVKSKQDLGIFLSKLGTLK